MEKRSEGMRAFPFEIIQEGTAKLPRRRDAQNKALRQRFAAIQCRIALETTIGGAAWGGYFHHTEGFDMSV